MARILIVDDEKSIRRTLGEFLHTDGHEVVEAENADIALQRLKETNFDVVVTDIILPHVTGVELLRRIQAVAPHVQVVMMTGEPTIETATESLRFGAADYLSKPITKADIRRVVTNTAKLKTLEDTKRRLEAENHAYQENLERLVDERTADLKAANKSLDSSRLAALKLMDNAVMAREYAEQTTAALQREASERRQAEEALRTSEERWQFALEGAGDGVWDWNVQTGDVFYSRQLKAMLGYEEHEFGHRIEEWEQRVHPEDLSQCHEDLTKYFQSAEPAYLNEHRMKCKDGSYKWILDRGKIVERTSDGQPRRVIGTHTDITARKRAEEEVRQMALMVDTAPNAITVHDFDGCFLYANQRTFELHGYRRDEFLALNLQQLDVPDDARQIAARLQELRARGEAVFKVTHFRKDGTTLPLEVSAKVTTWGGQKAILSVATDITERQRVEAALAGGNLLRTLVDHLPHSVYVKDCKGRFLVANRATAQLMGAAQTADLLGKTDADFYSRTMAANYRAVERRIFKTRRAVLDRIELRRMADGSDRYILTTKVPLKDPQGKLFALVGISRDITERKQAEAALREGEDRYRALFNRANDGISLLSADGELLLVNTAFARMHGYRVKEMLHMRLKDLDTPESIQLAPERMRRLLTGKAMTFEVGHRHKNGHVFPLEVSASRISSGGKIFLQCIHRDITERKQAEAALRESQQRYRTVADFTYDWEEWRAPDGRLLYISPSCLRITGYPAEAFLQRPGLIREILHPTDCNRVLEHMRQAVANLSGACEIEFRILHRNGQERWIAHACQPVHSQEGKFLGVRAGNRDITERKRLELELLDLNVRLEARVEERTALLELANRQLRLNEFSVQHASLPLCWIGPNARILRVNRAFTDLTGYAENKALSLKLFEVAPNYKVAEWPDHWRLLGKGKSLLLEFNVRRQDGGLVPMEAHLNHLAFERQEYGFVSLRDISAPKQMEAERRERTRLLAEARDAERARFARDLHDDTAQYLTALKLKIEAMNGHTGLPEEERPHLNQMLELVRKLLLDVRQMAWQLHPPMLGEMGLDEALRRACSEWSEQNGVKATYQNEGLARRRLPTNIETTLFRIAQEALTNVARHAAASQVSVLLQKRNHTISLIVEDDGKGFHVRRALASALDRHRLGLLGMRERAELAGGTLNIESRRRQGTTLFVRLALPDNSASKHAHTR